MSVNLKVQRDMKQKKVLLSERIVVSMEIESTVTAARKAVVDDLVKFSV